MQPNAPPGFTADRARHQHINYAAMTTGPQRAAAFDAGMGLQDLERLIHGTLDAMKRRARVIDRSIHQRFLISIKAPSLIESYSYSSFGALTFGLFSGSP